MDRFELVEFRTTDDPVDAQVYDDTLLWYQSRYVDEDSGREEVVSG